MQKLQIAVIMLRKMSFKHGELKLNLIAWSLNFEFMGTDFLSLKQ